MTTADEITYVDRAPAIPTHLGTDAPHVHHRGSDECLRVPDGEHCPTPAELRAEVERLAKGPALFDEMLRAITERAESAEAEVERLHRRETEMAMLASAEQDRADALQQQVAAALHTLARWEARGHQPECGQGFDPCERCAKAAGASVLRRILTPALGGPAAPTPEPTIAGHDGFGAPIMDHAQEPQPRCTCVPFPQGTGPEEDCPVHGERVERITDDRGDEEEHGEHKPGECSICDAARQQGGGEETPTYDRCPTCRHLPHPSGTCFNMASDNDCSCRDTRSETVPR